MPLASPLTDALQGWGTAVGALIALAALIAAVLAYRVQSKQLRHQQQQIADQQRLNMRQGEVLELQADELRESIADRRRVAADDRRAHASQVFLWVDTSAYTSAITNWPNGYKSWIATVENTSILPIYDIYIRWTREDKSWEPPRSEGDTFNPLSRLGPDTKKSWVARIDRLEPTDPWSVDVVAEFRDAREVWWRIKPDGRIEEIEPPTS